MKAVILAGGMGSRICEETHLKPKPMIEIGGSPILWHIMKIYSAHGINEFIVCLGYKGYVIKEYFANYFLHRSDVTFDMAHNAMKVHTNNVEPWQVTLVDTGSKTMTGGRLKRVREYLGDEDFCFTYGDGGRGHRHRTQREVSQRFKSARHRDCGAAAQQIWRPESGVALGARFSGKTGRRRRLDQRRLLCAVSAGHRLHRGRCHSVGGCADGAPGARGRLPPGLSAEASDAKVVGLTQDVRVSPIDDKVLDNIRALQMDGMPDLLSEMIDIYLTDTPPLIDALRRALVQGDVQVVHRAAHSLKSTSAHLGATALSALSKEVEKFWRDGDLAQVTARLPLLESEYQAVQAALKTIYDRVPRPNLGAAQR